MQAQIQHQNSNIKINDIQIGKMKEKKTFH